MTHPRPSHAGLPQIALLALAALVPGCAASRGAPALLDQAIAARFGPQAANPDGAIRTVTGSFHGIPFHSRIVFRHPNLLRWEFSIEGADRPVVQVFDGRDFYQLEADDRQRLMSPEEARTLLHRAFDESVFWLSILRDPNMIQETLPAAESADTAVDALLVTHRRGYVRTLSFDRDTHQLVAMEGRADTEFGRRDERFEFSAPVEVDGIRVPSRYRRLIDGELTEEGSQQFSFTDIPAADWFLFRGPRTP